MPDRPEPFLVGPVPLEADLELADEVAAEDRCRERGDADVSRLPTRLRLIPTNPGEAA